MKAYVVEVLSGPRAPAVVALVALLLALPSLVLAPVLDDHGFRWRLAVDQQGPDAAFHLVDAAAPTPTGTRMWWASPRSEVHFFRPLAALGHFIDYRMWPDAVWFMRLESCLLYAVLAWLAATAYRRLATLDPDRSLSPLTWGVAGVMFAVNEANAHSLSMIAGRNTLLYPAFGVLSLLCHHVYRESRGSRRLLGPLAFALSLLSGEGGLATLGYLGAYALCLDDRPRATRLRSLLPYAGVAAAWASVYAALGYGAGDGQVFRDPTGDPVGTLIAGLADLPVWIASQLSLGFATAAIAASPAVARLTALPIAALLVLVLWPTLRERRIARFHGLGALLSLAPLMATWPQDRLLVTASFGAFGLIACFFERAAQSPARSQRVMRGLMVAIHLVIAPLAFVPSYLTVAGVTRAENKVDAALGAADPSAIDVIVVRAPIVGTLGYTLVRRLAERRPVPRRSYELYAAGTSVDVTRLDARTLELAPAAGYCSSRAECIVRHQSMPFRAGERIDLPDMRVEVRKLTARGTPARVRFGFPSPLEDPARRWLVWTERGIEPFPLPAIGATTRLPALSALAAFR
jgi:hypothetical protein